MSVIMEEDELQGTVYLNQISSGRAAEEIWALAYSLAPKYYELKIGEEFLYRFRDPDDRRVFWRRVHKYNSKYGETRIRLKEVDQGIVAKRVL